MNLLKRKYQTDHHILNPLYSASSSTMRKTLQTISKPDSQYCHVLGLFQDIIDLMIKKNFFFSTLSSQWTLLQGGLQNLSHNEIVLEANPELRNSSSWIEIARDVYGLSGFISVLDHLLNIKYNFYQTKGLENYSAGTWGPIGADKLLLARGHDWITGKAYK